jgi:hypothetical protein
LTVSLSEFLPPGGGVRDNVAEGVWLEGLPLRRVLVLVYGFADSRAAEVGAARAVERRVGGIAKGGSRVVGIGAVQCCVCWWCGRFEVDQGRAALMLSSQALDQARSSRANTCASPLPYHCAGSPSLQPIRSLLRAPASASTSASVRRRTPTHDTHPSLGGAYARDVASTTSSNHPTEQRIRSGPEQADCTYRAGGG